MPTHINGGSPDMSRTTAAATGDKVADATDLLEREHRQVESWFHTCESLSDQQQKAELIQKICMALKVHTQIEEEIFYPRFRAETDEQGLVQESIDEHSKIKRLIAEVERRQAQGQDCAEQLRSMQQCVMHHVKEEETEMFPKARNTDIDLFALGSEMATRRSELMQQMAARKNHGPLDSGSAI